MLLFASLAEVFFKDLNMYKLNTSCCTQMYTVQFCFSFQTNHDPLNIKHCIMHIQYV
jgi:hypothetical protein